MINIGIIGLGYWGPNLLRNFSNNKKCQVVAICDTNKSLLKKYKKKWMMEFGGAVSLSSQGQGIKDKR